MERLCDWADVVALLCETMVEAIPTEHRHKVTTHFAVGPDRWSNPYNQELLSILERKYEAWKQPAIPPLVSCICPTYGRFPTHGHLLSDAVACFLWQDYPAKELVVFNDSREQTLVCELPGVRVVNMPTRYATLGEKYNAAIKAARGDIILPWEDDDVSLPHRISQAVERLKGHAYFNPRRSWYWHDKLHSDHQHGVCHNASAYTREAWEKVGGYPAVSGSQDATMDSRLRALGRTAPPLTDDFREWSYVYRWGMQPYHLSGSGDCESFYRDVPRPPAGVFMVQACFAK